MSDESDIRELRAQVEAFARQTAPARRRLAARRKAPGGERIAAELQKYAGLEPLVAALDGLGTRPDPASETLFDRIRRHGTARRDEAPDRDELQRRLHRR